MIERLRGGSFHNEDELPIQSLLMVFMTLRVGWRISKSDGVQRRAMRKGDRVSRGENHPTTTREP